MSTSHPDRDAELRARLAGAVLQPSPERVDRWLAAVEAATAAGPTAEPTATGPTATGPTAAEPTATTAAEPSRTKPSQAEPGAPIPLPVRRPARRRFTTGLAAAGLAAAVAAVVGVGFGPVTGPQDRPLTLTREQLRTNLPSGRDFGELTDPATRTACLARLGAAGLEPLAARPVLLDDRPGVLLVLPTDRPGRLRVLVVGPTCADVLADTTTG